MPFPLESYHLLHSLKVFAGGKAELHFSDNLVSALPKLCHRMMQSADPVQTLHSLNPIES